MSEKTNFCKRRTIFVCGDYKHHSSCEFYETGMVGECIFSNGDDPDDTICNCDAARKSAQLEIDAWFSSAKGKL